MNKCIKVWTLLSLLLITEIPFALAHNADLTTNPNIWGAPDPSTLNIDTIGEPDSLDPAWIYDTVSAEVVFNVYETLVFFDRDYTGLGGYYQAGKTDQFVPKLATSWQSKSINELSPEGLTWVKRFTFAIRLVNASGQPIRFHNGAVLATEDVEYSFERWMVQDRAGGALWMFMIWMLGDYYSYDPVTDPSFGLKIDHAVQHNATHVWFNMVLPAPDKIWLQILSQAWASIVNKAWVQSMGGLNVESVSGGWSNWAQIYDTWHDPWISEIASDMMGTGPYRFSFWSSGWAWSIVKFDDYWDGWPARKAEGSSERLADYVSTVIWYLQTSQSLMQTRFLNGVIDMAEVDRTMTAALVGQPGIRGWYGNGVPEPGEPTPEPDVLNTLSVTAAFFTFNINTMGGNPYAPTWYPSGTFGPNGIPPDIFSDVNVRKGFAYAFDYNDWIQSAYLGDGTHPTDPIIAGVLYDNPNQAGPIYDIVQAKNYLMLAWGGSLLATGTATGGSSTTIVDTSRSESSGYWNGRTILIMSGSGRAEHRVITNWDMDTHTFTLDAALCEAIYRDVNGNGRVDTSDVLLEGPARRDNVALLTFASDIVLTGLLVPFRAALSSAGPADTYYDADSSGSWSVGEPAIRDDGSGFYEVANDVVLVGSHPPVHSALSVPGTVDKYYDTNTNAQWDIGESAVRDSNNNSVFDGWEKHADNILGNGIYDPGEAIYSDIDNSGTITASDVMLLGPSQPLGTGLIPFASNEKHAENINANGSFDVVAVASGDGYGIYSPGALWTNGMRFTIPYNTGSTFRVTSAQIFTDNVNSLNPAKFRIDPPLGIPWGSQYLPGMVSSKIPIFMMGWLADYPDPDNLIFPFMHSQGTFSQYQHYSNPHVDALIETGAVTPDDTLPYSGQLDRPDPRPFMNNNPGVNIPGDTRWPRRSIYYELQAIYALDDVPSVTLVALLGRHWERDWIRGWYYNPVYPGEYAYHLWKARTHIGDVNNDGVVNVVDVAVISAHWGGPPAGEFGYAPQADLTGGDGATTAGDGQVLGIPDGKVDILDVSVVSAFWDGPPIGILHP